METYCKKELLEAGWTEGAISRFLPDPEIEIRHKYGGGYYEIYLWPKETVEAVRLQPAVKQYLEGIRERNKRRKARVPETLPLLVAIREISRAAHRWRDAASAQYEAGNYGLATHSSSRKKWFYELKERGIGAAFSQGLLRYFGQTAQGMAVYEYGEGGMSCFHSCLHPVGAERTLIADHPETLFVAAKEQKYPLADAEHTLSVLSSPGEEFERSSPPSMKKPVSRVTCWECGESGHIARDCPERFEADIAG